MKICFITKYPPIEGGVSSRAYWLIRGLGREGCKVFVVTNAYEVENEFRENLTGTDLKDYQPKNVKVYNTDPFIDPYFIPYFKPYTEKLASLAIDVIKNYDIQLIDSWYLLPYGIAGFLVKKILDKPQIIRHAGSDISRLFKSPYLSTLFLNVLKSAEKIITHFTLRKFFLKLGISKDKLFFTEGAHVDTTVFNPRVKPFDLSSWVRSEDIPIVTYIGKISIAKGVFELVKALSHIRKKDFRLLLVANGRKNEMEKLYNLIKKCRLENRTLILGFVPPWRIPSLIKASTCVVLPEHGFEIKHHSPITIREVMAVGSCLVLSEELYIKRPFKEATKDVDMIVIDPTNIRESSNKLEFLITHPEQASEIGKRGYEISRKNENFKEYVKKTLNLYRSLG